MNTQEATITRYCKIPNCTNEAKWTNGRYAGLCEEHRDSRVRTAPPRQRQDASQRTGGCRG